MADGARIRTNPSTSATVVGYGYRSHDATVHCGRVVANTQWYYHKNDTTGLSGWSRYDVLIPLIEVRDC
ncbi:hypothetical protein ACFW4X_14010 [Streptomyces smyrnaeus]|uniref:hypothetical protein n=1 Tax=Streptomyces smyrnaeus TaxID=1387713 RepID=UPI0036C92156